MAPAAGVALFSCSVFRATDFGLAKSVLFPVGAVANSRTR